MEDEGKSTGLRVEITWKTILKVLLGVLLAVVAIKLWPLFKLLAVASLLSVALYQIVCWARRRGWPRWVGLLLASATLIVALVGLFGLVGPVAVHQAAALGKDLPRIQQQVLSVLPRTGPVHDALQKAAASGTGADTQRLLGQGLSAAKTTVAGLFDLALVLVFTIYLMVDGPRALTWLIAYFPREQRGRVAAGLAEIGHRIEAYVAGQFIVSLLFGSFVFVFLSLLHVPMALLLAVLAAVFDVLPMIGIFLAVVPAMLLGLTVSPRTALFVLAGYSCYHLLEDYFILPKVYGNKLKLSTLAVLLAFVVGDMLAGVIGAVAFLPLVAAYPALERLWLRPALEPEVVEDHDKLRAA